MRVWLAGGFLLIVIIALGFVVSNQQSETRITSANVPSTAQATIKPTLASQPIVVKQFFVALEDGGKVGEEIGCGDSLVATEKKISADVPVIDTALKTLLTEKNEKVENDTYYNALAASDLSVDTIELTATGSAIVALTGQLVSNGVCDTPRIQNQLEQTLRQFPEVKNVEISINGQALDEVLSEQ